MSIKFNFARDVVTKFVCVGEIVEGVELLAAAAAEPGVSCVSGLATALSPCPGSLATSAPPPMTRPRTAPEAPVCSCLLLSWVRLGLGQGPAISTLSQLPPGLADPSHHSRHLVHAQHQHKVQFVTKDFTFPSVSEFLKNVSETLKRVFNRQNGIRRQ